MNDLLSGSFAMAVAGLVHLPLIILAFTNSYYPEGIVVGVASKPFLMKPEPSLGLKLHYAR